MGARRTFAKGPDRPKKTMLEAVDTEAEALVYSAALGTLPTRSREVKAKVDTARMRSQLALTLVFTIGGIGLAIGAGGCAAQIARPAPFRARPDSVARGDLGGPFTGRVIDSESDRPIPGALVYASWRFVTGTGFVAPSGFREWI